MATSHDPGAKSGRQAFAAFMAGSIGRSARAVLGIALVLIGWLAFGGTTGLVIALIGLVPLAASLLNVCLVAPLLGMPFRGHDYLR